MGIVIDDFGTGYSSLAYLWRFTFDKLKIDRSLVAELEAGSRAQTVVSSIISLAHTLGMSVTAEGIEDPAVAGELHAIGCDFVQGYAYDMPLRMPDIAVAFEPPSRQ